MKMRAVEFTFPDHPIAPPYPAQFTTVPSVAFDVACELAGPEFLAGGRDCCHSAPLMTMPEAAVDEDHSIPAGEDDVGVPGQVGPVEREPEPGSMQEGSDQALGERVLASNSGHHSASR